MIDESTIKIRDHFWMMVVVYLSTQSIAFIDMKLIVWSSVKLKSVSKNLLSFFFHDFVWFSTSQPDANSQFWLYF